MRNKYQNIIDEGEVTYDIIEQVVKNMGSVEKLNVKSSNGTSFVFISPEKNNVYQYFSNSNTVYRILKIIESILKVNIKLIFKNSTVEYNLYDFICQFISYKPDNIIVWKKHICLNFFDSEKIKKIINNNIVKLIWDIGKSLCGLHENKILHGDARIDNIGILNGKFILFDFDGSNLSTDNNKDIYDFIISIKFNVGDLWNNIKINIPENICSAREFIYDIIKIQQRNIPNCDIIDTLNNLKII